MDFSKHEFYMGHKRVNAMPMNRQQYNDFRGWELPADEDGSDAGYLVEYIDGGEPNTDKFSGYVSWSPKHVFEEAYRSSGNLTFGDAIELMKAGCKMARSGWNGKGMWVIYNPGSKGQTHAMFDGSVYKNHGVDECEILPHFDMYTVNAEGRRAMLPGWLASQSDMIATDWVVVG
ncbi:MAG TPA: DUF2829 domain-containing protein [Oligella sp.]|nr:DUF2829 domain-containing protein [Oligella sp.]